MGHGSLGSVVAEVVTLKAQETTHEAFRQVLVRDVLAVLILLAAVITLAVLFETTSVFGASVNGPVAPDGEEVQNDLPKEFPHIRNRGGSDGKGLCVFASLNHSAIWQITRSNKSSSTCGPSPAAATPTR